MKDWKLIAEKQAELIKFYEKKLSMGEIHSAFDIKSELSLLESQQVEGLTIDEMLKGCEHDGSYIPVSEVRRLLSKYAQQSSKVTDEDIEKAAKEYNRRAFCGQYAGEEPSYHFMAGVKAHRDGVIKKSN